LESGQSAPAAAKQFHSSYLFCSFRWYSEAAGSRHYGVQQANQSPPYVEISNDQTLLLLYKHFQI
jgi:hypothetical protein